MKKIQGTAMLVGAALIWGVALVEQKLASANMGAFTFNAFRCLIGFVFLLGLVLIRKLAAKKSGADNGESAENADAADKKAEFAALIKAGVICGVTLFAMASFQQFGIGAYPEGVPASGRGGFLTSTYVVMVALFARFTGKKIHPLVFVSVAGCLAGMYFICVSGDFTAGIYLGDVLMILSAVGSTSHIIAVGRCSRFDGVKVSCVQFLVCAVLSLICSLIFETVDFEMIKQAIVPILYMGIMSSGIAYTLQMYGQRHVEPAVAAVALSLESVFAVLGGWLMLGESMSPRELFGCVLVFAAVILAQIPDMMIKKTSGVQTDGKQ